METISSEIMFSLVSYDRNTIYFINSEEICVDSAVVKGFGISAASRDSIEFVRDVSVDFEAAKLVLNELQMNSVKPDGIYDFISNFLSEI